MTTPRIHPLVSFVQKAQRLLPGFRGKGRLLSALLSPLGLQLTDIGGLKAELDMSDQFERSAALGLFEQQVADALRANLARAETFCDCGAHVGVVSILMAEHLSDGGVVHAFEPSPPTFSRLARNFEISSPLTGCRLHAVPVALGSQADQRLTLYVSSQNGWSTFLADASSRCVRLGAPVREEVQVGMTTLDAFFLGAERRRPPQAIKIDVEGFEYEVLQGASQLLREFPPRAIVVERNDELLACVGRSFDPVEGLLRSAGYVVHERLPNDVVYRMPRRSIRD